MENQSHFIHCFFQESFIPAAQIQNTEITKAVLYVLKDLMCLSFVQDKLKSVLAVFLYHIHKGIRCKSVVLCRNTEPGFFRLVCYEPVLQQIHFLDDLSRISKEFHPFFSQRNSCAASGEDAETNFTFCFFDSSREAGL